MPGPSSWRLIAVVGLLVARGAVAGADGGVAPVRVWQIPEVIDVVDVPGRSEAMGMPVGIHAVRSKASVALIEDALARQFRDAGLFFPPRQDLVPSSTSPQLTGLDPDSYIAYTVFLQPNPDGTTTVILTEAFLGERRAPPKKVPFAPLMPKARQVLVSRTEGLDLLDYTVAATPAEIDAFDDEAARRAGYLPTGPRAYQRGPEVLEVKLRPAGAGEQQVRVLHRLKSEAGAPGSPDQARQWVAPQSPGGAR